jgi:hypothetical protein
MLAVELHSRVRFFHPRCCSPSADTTLGVVKLHELPETPHHGTHFGKILRTYVRLLSLRLNCLGSNPKALLPPPLAEVDLPVGSAKRGHHYIWERVLMLLRGQYDGFGSSS